MSSIFQVKSIADCNTIQYPQLDPAGIAIVHDDIVFDLAKDIVTGLELQMNLCVLPSQSNMFIKTSLHHIMFQHVTMENSNSE